MPAARGAFEVTAWNEDAYEDRGDGAKLTKASVAQRFTGDLEGDGAVEWLMVYRPDGTARFVGLQRITGRVADRAGSFVLETSGEFDGTVAGGTWTVVPGSGTGELRDLAGDGSFEAPMGGQPTFELDYELA